jgi:cysteine desulfurase/selenocysteine lyase
VRQPERLIFTANGTDALNLALHGLLRAGDHVVTTVVEHNSTLRPLRSLEDQGLIEVTRVGCDSSGIVNPDDIRRALTTNTRLAAISHVSNVTGAMQPIDEIRDVVQRHGARLLVDAAQSIGHLPIELDVWGVDFVAASGHKGLLGPLGTGILYLRHGLESEIVSVRQGGTGTRSEDDRQPSDLPSKYESGNLNVPGIAGLGAATEFLFTKTIAALRAHDLALCSRLLDGLQIIRGVRIHGPKTAADRVGLVSVSVEGYDPQEVAAALDAVHRIQVRPGLHCAPLMHRALGTIESGGTVRFSLGQFNTREDIDAAITAVAELVASSP